MLQLTGVWPQPCEEGAPMRSLLWALRAVEYAPFCAVQKNGSSIVLFWTCFCIVNES